MSDKTDSAIERSTREFAATLLEDPAVIEFRTAEAALENDPEFVRLSESYNGLAQQLQQKQSDGSLTQEQINELRELQAQINSHSAAQRFIAAREQNAALVHDCNHEISSILGFDFGAVAGPRGGCSC